VPVTTADYPSVCIYTHKYRN